MCYAGESCWTLWTILILRNHRLVAVVAAHSGDGASLRPFDVLAIYALLKAWHGLLALRYRMLFLFSARRHSKVWAIGESCANRT